MSKEKSNQQWESENDARILMDSETIKKDTPRLNRAKVAAKKMMIEEQKKVTALKVVAKVKKKENVGGGKVKVSGTKKKAVTKTRRKRSKVLM